MHFMPKLNFIWTFLACQCMAVYEYHVFDTQDRQQASVSNWWTMRMIDGALNEVQPSANAVCQLVWPIFFSSPWCIRFIIAWALEKAQWLLIVTSCDMCQSLFTSLCVFGWCDDNVFKWTYFISVSLFFIWQTAVWFMVAGSVPRCCPVHLSWEMD